MANDSIGALWKQEGKIAFSGSIEIAGEKIKIVAFKNDYKTEDKHPDYKIYRAKEKGDKPPSGEDALNKMGIHEEPDETDLEPF